MPFTPAFFQDFLCGANGLVLGIHLPEKPVKSVTLDLPS
jgi:hypothetical protein